MYRKLENLNDASSDDLSTKLYLDRGEVKRVVQYQQCVQQKPYCKLPLKHPAEFLIHCNRS